MSAYEPPKRMACVACTKAKRKCGKEEPACARCMAKNQDCTYPIRGLMLPPSAVAAEDEGVPSIPAERRWTFSPPSQSIPPQVSTALTVNLARPWFLAQSSWAKRAIDMTGVTSFRRDDLFYFTDEIQKWPRKWTSEASCPFIHCQLYGPDLPECLQDAYTAAAAYGSTTSDAKTTVLCILEHRSGNLLHEQELSLNSPEEAGILDTATRLARTQALLVYEIIRLFDGDIGSRHDAECHLPTLVSWAESLRQSAELDIGTGDTEPPLAYFDTGADNWTRGYLRTDGRLSTTWRAWVFSESIRRTWYAVMLTQSVYSMLKQEWPGCHGSIPFMGGKGVWDAPTPYTWLEALQTDSVSVVRSLTDPRLLTEVPSSDVDDLTQAVLISVYGLERIERWTWEGPRGQAS